MAAGALCVGEDEGLEVYLSGMRTCLCAHAATTGVYLVWLLLVSVCDVQHVWG